MICKDQSISMLKSFGYNMVRLPKADYAPLQIFIKNKGYLEPLGSIFSILLPQNGAKPPEITRDIIAASINGQRTSDLSLGIGLNVLGGVIREMGGKDIGLDAGFKQAKTIQFLYTNVLEDSVKIAELDKFLANSDVDPSSRHIGKLLEADEIFVLTSTIKTKNLTVEGKQSKNTTAKLEVPIIKEVVGGKVEVTTNSQSNLSVTFTGDVPLVFGFKAVKLFYEEGVYQRFDPAKAGGIGLCASTLVQPESKSLYVSENTFESIK